MIADEKKARPVRVDMFWIALLSVGINLLLILFIGLNRPAALQDYHVGGNPDGNQYVQLGTNIWLKGVYSRQSEPPYQPDIKWTPLYPMLAGGIQALLKTIWPLYALQVIFSTATALLLYSMAASMFGRSTGLIAGILYAVDLMIATLNVQVLSESFFIFASTASIFLWTRILWTTSATKHPFRDHIILGTILGLTILIRPTALYLPMVLGIFEFLVFLVRKQRRAVFAPAALIAVAYLVTLPWIARNYVVYGMPRLTIVDSLNLAYYVGAGVYQVQFGIETIQEAQAKISADYALVPATQAHNFWLAGENVAAMDAAWRKAAWDIFSKYPGSLARSVVTSIVIGLTGHDTNDLARITGKTWANPGLAYLRSMDFGKFVGGLLLNHPVFIFIFIWQALLVIANLILGSVGMITSLFDGSRRLLCGSFLVIIAYYVATMAMQGLTPDARMRAPLVPLMHIFSAIGAIGIWNRWPHLQAERWASQLNHRTGGRS